MRSLAHSRLLLTVLLGHAIFICAIAAWVAFQDKERIYQTAETWSIVAIVDLPATLIANLGCLFFLPYGLIGSSEFHCFVVYPLVFYLVVGSVQWWLILKAYTSFAITRKRLQFSLRTFLIVVTAICLALGWREATVQRHVAAVARLEARGIHLIDSWVDPPGPNALYTGWIFYTTLPPNGYFSPQFESKYCLRGGEWCYSDESVVFSADDLRSLRNLTHVRTVTINNSELRGPELEGFNSVQGLGFLDLASSKIDDSDVPHLGKLNHLKELHVVADLSPAGIAELKRALPNCNVIVRLPEN